MSQQDCRCATVVSGATATDVLTTARRPAVAGGIGVEKLCER